MHAECDGLPDKDRALCRGEITLNEWCGVGPDAVFLVAAQQAWDASQPSRGFGDTVAKLTHATGINVVVKVVLGSGCGCQSRQARWNRRWPYSRKES